MTKPPPSTVERIKKLLAMTVANGCTEAEAMAAAGKAARLMAELGLAEGDLEFAAQAAKVTAGWSSARAPLWSAIATCTNCCCLMIGDSIEYIGRDPWPDVARYLHQVVSRAIDTELRAFKADRWYRRRSSVRAKRAAAHDFTAGMVARLRRKLFELFGGTVDRDQIEAAESERDRRHPDTVKEKLVSRRPKLAGYLRAAEAGRYAGEGVVLSHGVGGDAACPVAIGRSE